MRIISLWLAVLLTVQALKQIHIAVPRNARDFIQQQLTETNHSKAWWDQSETQRRTNERDPIFETYPTLIPNGDLSTQIYEETTSTDGFGAKRLFTTLFHESSNLAVDEPDEGDPIEMDAKTAKSLLLSGGTAEEEVLDEDEDNQEEQEHQLLKKSENQKEDAFLIYQSQERENQDNQSHQKKKKENLKHKDEDSLNKQGESQKDELKAKVSIDEYRENLLGRQHINQLTKKAEDLSSESQKSEESLENKTKYKAESPKISNSKNLIKSNSLSENSRSIEYIESSNSSSFITRDGSEESIPNKPEPLPLKESLDMEGMTTTEPSKVRSSTVGSEGNEGKENLQDSRIPRPEKAKKIPDSQNLYLVDGLQDVPVQGFPNDKRTTIPSAKIPQNPRFNKRFKLNDPEDAKPEELLIFRRIKERKTTLIPATKTDPEFSTTKATTTTVIPESIESSFVIDDNEINIQRTTLDGFRSQNDIDRVSTTTPTPATTENLSTTKKSTKKSKKKRRRRKKIKKRKLRKKTLAPEDQKIKQLSLPENLKDSEHLEESSFKVLGSKTYVDGSMVTTLESKENLPDYELKTTSRPAQFRKRTIAPYKSQIKQYFVTKPPEENVVEMPAIVDKETSTGYTGKQLTQMCDETRHMGASWGIHDIADFAQKNCPLIRLYYPNVSCGQINQFIDYCNSNHLF